LKNAIGTLTAQSRDKLKGFIVDLRNNPGGLVEQAVSVSNAFLKRGEIVSTRGRHADEINGSALAPTAISARASRSSC
jgi:carboxyl-terminal processing protease